MTNLQSAVGEYLEAFDAYMRWPAGERRNYDAFSPRAIRKDGARLDTARDRLRAAYAAAECEDFKRVLRQAEATK